MPNLLHVCQEHRFGFGSSYILILIRLFNNKCINKVSETLAEFRRETKTCIPKESECTFGHCVLMLGQLSLALKASAYMRICFTMASKPLLRVGERCSCRPMRGMK